MQKIFCEYSILRTMRFITDHNNIMVRINWFGIRLVEFLNQGEYERRIAFQLRYQVIPAACNETFGFHIPKHTAILKCVTDLFVQFFSVGQDYDCWRPREFPSDFTSKEQHGIALAASLCMPENS